MIGADRADMQLPGLQAFRLVEEMPRVLFFGEQARGDREQVAAGLGQFGAAVAPVKEFDARFLFQRRDLRRQCRLADIEDLCRGDKSAGLGDGMERPELGRIHSFFLSILKKKSICQWSGEAASLSIQEREAPVW